MKTVKKINSKTNEPEYRRLADFEAENLIRTGWAFCSKNEWKTNVRDFNKNKQNSEVQEEIYIKDKKKEF